MRRIILLFVLFAVLDIPMILAQSYMVKGHVISADDKQPLIGVSILEKGTTNGVITDIDGNYSLAVTKSPATLQFSYIGMTTVEKQVTGTSTVNITMENATQVVDEVVVVAYGVRKKGTIAGSVSVVKGDKLENTPTASFDQALQGQTPGLQVLSSTGEPSASASFQIRGVNSINSGTSPLFIMDGIAISADDFSAINPSDIESVSVLKDASSTSIYGARAANGVVVITTKRGKMGEKGKFNFRTQAGFSTLAYGKWDQMNTTERLNYEEEIGLKVPGQYDRETLERTNIDWRDVVYNDHAPVVNSELSFSGANQKVNYYMSLGYYRQEGVAIGSDFRRYSFRTNVEAKVTDWLKVGTNSAFSYEQIEEADENSYTTVTPISASRFMLPYWNPYKKDGSIASITDDTWKGTNQNPLEWLKANPAEKNKAKLTSTFYAELAPIKGLTIRSLIGVDAAYYIAEGISLPSYVPNSGVGMVGRSSQRSYNLSITNTVNYMFTLEDIHSFNVMLGQEAVDNGNEGFSVTTRGQGDDRLLSLTTGTLASSWNDTFSSSSYMSWFGRAEYNYDNKYYLDLSVRRDGSSKFGKNSRWAHFWSVGAMWNAKAESFLENIDWLTNAQLSASAGTSGNSSIPPYDHHALVAGGAQYMGMSAIAPYSRGNENLTWEKLFTTNVALKLGFFNRANLGVEFYNKKTSDMLMEVPTTFGTGFPYRWDNIGAMVNRGLEIDASVDVIQNRGFVWTLFGNVSYNHNEITELYNGLDDYELSTTGIFLKKGHSYGEFYLTRYAGVNPANGDALWYDKNGNLTNEYSEEDKVLMGKSYLAPWQGGFGTSLSWKGVTLSAQFSWVKDRWMMNNDRYFDESNGTFAAYNQSKKLLYDRWKNPGDVTEIPRNGIATQMDSHLLEDASFLRLKNLSLSYSFPSKMLKKTKVVENIRLYAQGQNLLTFTKFQGMDPESDRNMYQAAYPLSRQFTFGLEIGF